MAGGRSGDHGGAQIVSTTYPITESAAATLAAIPHDELHYFSDTWGPQELTGRDRMGGVQRVKTGHFVLRRGGQWFHGRYWDETWTDEPEWRRHLPSVLRDRRWVVVGFDTPITALSGLHAEHLWRDWHHRIGKESTADFIRGEHRHDLTAEFIAECADEEIREERALEALRKRLKS